MLTPLGDGAHRFVFGSTTTQPGRDAPVSDSEVSEALTALYGPETRLGEVYGASRFNDATRQLERYRHGRVLFAGDAAHIHPPLGGQGRNLGVQDAMNLGWKLAATVRGTAPGGLLDSYHDERHPAAERVLRHTAAQRVFTAPGRGENVEALREIVIDLMRTADGNRYFSGLLSGLALEYPGARRVPDLDLTTADGPTRLSTLLHGGRGLLLDLATTRCPAASPGRSTSCARPPRTRSTAAGCCWSGRTGTPPAPRTWRGGSARCSRPAARGTPSAAAVRGSSARGRRPRRSLRRGSRR
ncbi:FAD-dependent monooxygenase [Amycolatopsis australiensis]|uniref:FAD-dependent monooxygenase n=1 Tax=Amycolatopsis australiensis TaxID=546364 RepID=UPI001C436472|nr:FAD-dependent monooxygenase [Amycolatopsis australiensis]